MSSIKLHQDPDSVYAIHTSDRILFKRCRRKWDFASPLRRNLSPIGTVQTPLWFGTGFHFALEDFHGHHLWASPGEAFAAYAQACGADEKPFDADMLVELAGGMFSHYEKWLAQRDEYDIAVFRDGLPGSIDRPATEVNFSVALPQVDMFDRPVFYEGTLDGIYTHRSTGHYFVAEYKTAKVFDVRKLMTDDQVSAYVWVMRKCLPDAWDKGLFGGVVYKQFKKTVPSVPKALVNGTLSTNKQQKTTYSEYRAALEQMFPGVPVTKLDSKYQEMLSYLSMQETYEGDDYINQQVVTRTNNNVAAQEMKICLDAFEMLNNPAITTNPTRDCAWDCPFRDVCIAMDEGADWEGALACSFGQRSDVAELWQQRLIIPEFGRNGSLNAEAGKTWQEYKDERRLIING